MDPVQNLINSVFGSSLWNATSLLDKIGDNSALPTMVNIGYAFAALMLIIQLVITVLNISKDQNVWENIGPLIYRTVIIAALISIPLYSLLFRYTLAGTTNAVANAIFSDYAKDFLSSWQNVFKAGGSMPSTPWDIITASFNNSLVSNILSSIIFLAAIVCVFIVAMLQPFLWLFCYYVGPICLAFAICDLTTHVARNWLNMFLVVNFVGIFGSISFVVAQAAGPCNEFPGRHDSQQYYTGRRVWNNVNHIILRGMADYRVHILRPKPHWKWRIGPGRGRGSAAGAMAFGAGMAGTGAALSRFAPAGSRLGQVASGMQSHGKGLMQASENINNVSRGRAPRAEAASGSQQGSQQTESSIKNVKQSGPSGQQASGGGSSGASTGSQPEQRNSSIPDGNS